MGARRSSPGGCSRSRSVAPAPLSYRGSTVETGIVKAPVPRPLTLTTAGFPGDEQADLSVHGGPDKAACAYPSEHVGAWERELGTTLPPGAFGENLTLAGLLEDHVRIGDVFALGEARVQISQPRGPCFKLAARWGVKDLPDRMAKRGVSGFYFRVLAPGAVAAGDRLTLQDRTTDLTVAEVMRVTYRERHDLEAVGRVLAVPELADQWRALLVRWASRFAA